MLAVIYGYLAVGYGLTTCLLCIVKLKYFFMQEQHDYLKSSFWCKEEIIDPYQTIALIFDEANVSIYRNNIKNILRTIHSYRRWKEHPLNNPFFTFEKLELMIND